MKLNAAQIKTLVDEGRKSELANFNDSTLGPLKLLPGSWKNTDELNGFGFNLMALPFFDAPNRYRVLMNQYNENLDFAVVDKGVPNRGNTDRKGSAGKDQTIVALNYFQKIVQVDSDDFPKTGLHDRFDGKPIHKEPGLWLHMTDHQTDGMNIARLGTIPHGNSFLAAGRFEERDVIKEPSLKQMKDFVIPMNGVVVGEGEDPKHVDLEPFFNPDGTIRIDYFEPYRHFHQNPYFGKISIPGFSGFEPVHTTVILKHAIEKIIHKVGSVKKVMRLQVDSTLDHAGINSFPHSGIVNIPFVVREADATAMRSIFYIYEVEDSKTGKPRQFMQYSQNVILDFIGRPDGHPGRARWPHISANTMERVSEVSAEGIMETLI